MLFDPAHFPDWPPPRVEPYLRRRLGIEDEAERTHLLGLMADIAIARHLRFPQREAARSFQTFAGAFLDFLRHVRWVLEREGSASYQSLLPRAITRDALRTLLAKVLLVHHERRHHPPQAPRRPPPRRVLTETIRRFLGVFRSAVRSGVFPRVVAQPSFLSFENVWNEAQRLVATSGHECWQSPLVCALVRPPAAAAALATAAVEVTEDHVRALTQAAVHDHHDGIYLCLLYTTGLRNAAIAGLRVDDVWDREARCVRRRCAVREKNSTWRTVVPRTELTERLTAFLGGLSPGELAAKRYVLEVRRGRRPSVRGLQYRLARLCARAGIAPALSPHRFRAFVVNHGMAQGASLREMSLFLGHSTSDTTYQHYWTRRCAVDHKVGRALYDCDGDGVPGPFPVDGAEGEKRARLQALRAQIECLRRSS